MPSASMMPPRPDPVLAIADFVRGYSVEATRPSENDIAVLTDIAPPATRVYLSAVAGRPVTETITAAARLARAGFEPVPHLAVRSFASATVLEDFLARVAGEGGVRRMLVIAGDSDPPAGDFRCARDVIDGGWLQRHGIMEIGIAGYPDGHPRLAPQELDRFLLEKIDAAAATGLKVHIVTQFGFDPAPILAWVGRLRAFGIDHPVRIGLAGPTSFATLLRYAKNCGVRASALALARQAGLVRQLFAMAAPDALVRSFAQAYAAKQLGDVKPHFYSFGGLAGTARWAEAVARSQITIDASAGFRVEPADQT
jgi:methylenetetrahydrofolate reductase (NADPH)